MWNGPVLKVLVVSGILIVALHLNGAYDLESPGDGGRYMEPAVSARAMRILHAQGGVPPRGAIVWFEDPREGGVTLVARVVGVPGDVVAIEDGRLRLNGAETAEAYAHGHVARERRPPVRIPEGFVYCLNDARASRLSVRTDSRGLGPIPLLRIQGFSEGDDAPVRGAPVPEDEP